MTKAGSMRGSFQMINITDMGFEFCQQVIDMRANGKMDRGMERDCLLSQTVIAIRETLNMIGFMEGESRSWQTELDLWETLKMVSWMVLQ